MSLNTPHGKQTGILANRYNKESHFDVNNSAKKEIPVFP